MKTNKKGNAPKAMSEISAVTIIQNNSNNFGPMVGSQRRDSKKLLQESRLENGNLSLDDEEDKITLAIIRSRLQLPESMIFEDYVSND